MEASFGLVNLELRLTEDSKSGVAELLGGARSDITFLGRPRPLFWPTSNWHVSKDKLD